MPSRKWIAVAGFALTCFVAAGPLRARETASDGASAPVLARGEAYTHLMRALFALTRDDYGPAVDEVHRALELEPDSPELQIEGAKLLLRAGRQGEAERLARKTLELEEDNTEALRFLADLFLARSFGSASDDNRNEAMRLYERLAALEDPADPYVLTMLVKLHHEAGDLDGAIRSARAIVALKPGDPKATMTLAQLLLQKEDGAEALRVILAYVVDHPDSEDLLAFVERLAANFDGWEIVADALGERAPFPGDHPAITGLMAEAMLRCGRNAPAAEALERLLAADPDDRLTRQHLVVAYRNLGRLADAAELLAGLIEESPEVAAYRQLLGEILEMQGDPTGARAAYGAALRTLDPEAAPEAADALRERMVLLDLDEKDLAAARSTLGELDHPDGAVAIRLRARLAMASEDWEDARRQARRLRSVDEDGYAALLEGEIEVRDKRWSKASAKFDEAIERLGPYARRGIAEVYREAGREEAGLAVLRSWVEAEPEQADARFLLGEFLYKLGRFDEAEPELREAFRLNPNHARALNFLGYSLAERNLQLPEALEMIQRALALDGWNAAYLDSLGWVYYQMGRFEEARTPLERAVRDMPRDPTVLEHLGDVYLALGEREQAFEAWDRALGAGPEDPDALREKIARERAAAGEESRVGGHLEASSLPSPP